MHNILMRPLVTEKITNLSEDGNKYGFVVALDANKIEIAKAINNRFEVEVVKVNTIKNHGKLKTQFTKRGRFSGRTARYKKAIVTIKEGQTIDLFGEV